MITLRQLGEALGDSLEPLSPESYSASEIGGVHISELADPTDYLDGGELLLTTGLLMASGQLSPGPYVQRLKDHGVAALGLGLGPSLREVPTALLEACQKYELDLVLIPEQAAFQEVTRRFWSLSMAGSSEGISGLVGTQTALARAAIRPDAGLAVLKALAQALGGWAAYLSDENGRDLVWPETAQGYLPTLRAEAQRLSRNAAPSAATFQLQNHPAVLYPIHLGAKVHGVLGIGPGRRLTPADRQVLLTVTVLLTLRARNHEQQVQTHATLAAAVAKLVVNGHLEAARLLAEDAGLRDIPARVAILGVRGAPTELSPAELGCILETLPACDQLHFTQALAAGAPYFGTDDAAYYVLDESLLTASATTDGADTSPNTSPPSAGSTPLGGAGITAILATGCDASNVAEKFATLAADLVHVPAGRVHLLAASPQARADAWVLTLSSYQRADLLGAVTGYLRCRGVWDQAARHLGVHRNTLRYRIQLAQSLLEVDLDDPDAAAHLWLALARHRDSV
ncbi:PucR family transcriptional regulator ligand-binding domain-containing protein [Glutamicibacter sp. PS]|uniref:PucR family transcriptional regulator n=1 Tax=Glutamicibacter sp. PS TaxID=3075634 RepID=UPI00284F5CE7|nr:PucR family transcriptional regulator ligand-binding domain-containing protein [Glutamicibacter sp. PS]MDR4533807.1 PucR family transcriptional regulator [Glutamicibacter sp. PS]